MIHQRVVWGSFYVWAPGDLNPKPAVDKTAALTN